MPLPFLHLVASVVAGLLAVFPAQADVVWPALVLETRLFTWWAIGLGLVIEFFFIWKVFDLSPKRALAANLAANAASTFFGLFLIPIGGFIWEIFPGLAINSVLNWGTFNPVAWGATFLIACLINAWLENFVLKEAFVLPFTRRTFCWLFLANALSVGIALGSVWWKPVHI